MNNGKTKKKLCPMAQQFFDPRIKNNLTVYKLSTKKKQKTFNQPL
jgi:hypothetical protein